MEKSSSQWFNPVWEVNSGMQIMPSGVEMMDLFGDGRTMLIFLNLSQNLSGLTNVTVFSGCDQVTEYVVEGFSCAVVGFFTENDDKKTAAIAIGSGTSIFILKDMKPYFKYCLPKLIIQPQEQNLWLKAGLEKDFNIESLYQDLNALKENIGSIHFSPKSLKLLSLKNNSQRDSIILYQRLPITKSNTITTITCIRRDSWDNVASSYIVIGTELGEVFILDQIAFIIIDKYYTGWSHVIMATVGLWIGDGHVIVGSRHGIIGTLRRKKTFQKLARLSSPIVALTPLSHGIAVVTMSRLFSIFSYQGHKLWVTKLQKFPLDMISLSIPKNGLTLLAVSIASIGVKVYDRKTLIDSINSFESISTIKYGQLGREEHGIAIVMCRGKFALRILKCSPYFETSSYQFNSHQLFTIANFFIVKRTRFFIEQTIRERLQAKTINSTLQHGFLRLRLNTALHNRTVNKKGDHNIQIKFTFQTLLMGLGPKNIIQISITNILNGPKIKNLYFICKHRNATMHPQILELPNGKNKLYLSITSIVVFHEGINTRIKLFLCSKDYSKPLAAATIIFPAVDETFQL